MPIYSSYFPFTLLVSLMLLIIFNICIFYALLFCNSQKSRFPGGHVVCSDFYAPNFEEVFEGILVWACPCSMHACVCASVTLACVQERLKIESWNLICGISMKNKRTRIFFFFSDGIVVLE